MFASAMPSRLLGFVQLRMGEQVVSVPVQSLKVSPDGGRRPGGFYAEGGELGIYVDAAASEGEVAEQIRVASKDAARHLSRRYAN